MNFLNKAFQKPCFLFLFTAFVLFFNFYDHRLSSLSLHRFLDNEFPSEGFAISRLVHNLNQGAASEGGFMIRYDHVDILRGAVDKEPYKDFKAGLDGADYQVYMSHAGYQDDLIWPLWRGLSAVKSWLLETKKPGSRWHTRMMEYDLYYFMLVTQVVLSLVNALILALAFLWISRILSPAAALLCLGGFLVFIPEITFFGRSIWWMMGVWFIPFLISAWALELNKGAALKGVVLALTGAIAGGALMLKTLMGYEFTSTIMVAALIPFAFYALLSGWNLRTWIMQSAVVSALVLAGFTGAIYTHFNQIQATGHDALQVIQSRFEMRAHGGETLDTSKNMALIESTHENIFAVIGKYLLSGEELTWPLIIFAFPFLIWLVRGIRQSGIREFWRAMAPLDRAISGAVGLGFLGGVSMLVILKGHAAIHGFDIVIWALPMKIFLLMFYARKILSGAAHRNVGQ